MKRQPTVSVDRNATENRKGSYSATTASTGERSARVDSMVICMVDWWYTHSNRRDGNAEG